jgi:hypothetical protein
VAKVKAHSVSSVFSAENPITQNAKGAASQCSHSPDNKEYHKELSQYSLSTWENTEKFKKETKSAS